MLDAIKRNKRYTFAKPPASKETSLLRDTQKMLEMENIAMTKIVGIAKERKLDLDEIMHTSTDLRLNDVPLAIFNLNGFLRNVVKSNLVEELNL